MLLHRKIYSIRGGSIRRLSHGSRRWIRSIMRLIMLEGIKNVNRKNRLEKVSDMSFETLIKRSKTKALSLWSDDILAEEGIPCYIFPFFFLIFVSHSIRYKLRSLLLERVVVVMLVIISWLWRHVYSRFPRKMIASKMAREKTRFDFYCTMVHGDPTKWTIL